VSRREHLPNSTSPRILVVDDTPTNVVFLERVLAAEGFRTLVARDGPAARTLSLEENPDLILLDIMMPGESGFETCTRLKSDPATADIPIIFLSALDDLNSRINGLQIGGVDYVTKPVHREELLARVRIHLRVRESNLRLAERQCRQLEQLRSAQRTILIQPEETAGRHFSVCYRPLEEAGGDFYDVVELGPDVTGYFVADVSGHNLGAAFLTSALKALLRQYTVAVFSPEEMMWGIDKVMRHLLGEDQYLTACYARHSHVSGWVSIVNAGHPPAILLSASGSAEVLEMESEPLGMFGSVVLQRIERRMYPGDRLFLYSDGLIEASPGGGRIEGLRQLVEVCRAKAGTPLPDAATAIVDELQAIQRAGDDVVLLVVEAEPQ
jgi:sigma-B regulation protein RsbU (phosphoserine phosphatase)